MRVSYCLSMSLEQAAIIGLVVIVTIILSTLWVRGRLARG